MKQYLIKTILFISIPFFIYASLFYLLKCKFASDIDDHPAILLGDSHTEFIRNPAIFNHCIHASPYFVHYEFSKQFISELKGKKIYIACNYHNLSKLYQNRLANDSLYKGWRASMFSHLDDYHLFNYKYPHLRPSDLDYSIITLNKFTDLFHRVILKYQTENSTLSIKNDTISIKENIRSHFNNKGHVLVDSIQRLYLNKLVTLLIQNDCEVVLLKMPVTRYYYENVPNDLKNELEQIADDNNIRMLDLNNELSISQDYSYFKDYGHLNLYGDTLVNSYFIEHEIK